MNDITLSKEEKSHVVSKIKDYFTNELEQDIGGFEAEFLIDFFIKEIGPYCYNRGLADAHALLSTKVDEFDYQLQEIEKPLL